MLPDGAHLVNKDSVVFFLRKKTDTGYDFYYCLNCYKTKLDKSIKRGAQVKAIAIASKIPYCLTGLKVPTKKIQVDQIEFGENCIG